MLVIRGNQKIISFQRQIVTVMLYPLIKFSERKVDTKKTGEYQISYTTEPVNETKPAVQSRLFSMFSNETPRQLTTVATVHVIDRNPTPLPDKMRTTRLVPQRIKPR